jgi:MFS family permease
MLKALDYNGKKIVYIFLNYFFAPILFCWLSYSIYVQIQQQPDLQLKWNVIKATITSFHGALILAIVFMLMIINWSFEAQKWKVAIRSVQPLNFLRAFCAVLSGVSFSVTTPNRTGEYLGRMLYMDEGKRLKIIALTIVTGMSQLIITLFTGWVGLLFIHKSMLEGRIVQELGGVFWLRVLEWGVLLVLISLTMFYFRLSFLVDLVSKWKNNKWFYLVSSLRELNATLAFRLLSLSAARYLIFIIQYFLLLRLFDVDINWWNTFAVISVIFLVLAIIPSFTIAELGLRGGVSLYLLGSFSTNHAGIAMTTACIWMINLVIPAIIGSLLILRIKIVKNRNEKNFNSSI